MEDPVEHIQQAKWQEIQNRAKLLDFRGIFTF